MKTNKLSKIFSRAKEIYQREGLVTLLKRVLADFENSTFYIYEVVLERGNEADVIPKIQNVTYKIVETKQQLDELSNNGFDLSILDIAQARYRLGKGAIATLIFVERELAARGWLALTEEAKNTFNNYPYKVDFSNKEMCSGDVLTHEKYQRLGLNKYGAYKRNEYLMGKGMKKMWSIALTSNIASQRAHETQKGRRIYAKARYIRIFGLQFWKETPVESIENSN